MRVCRDKPAKDLTGQRFGRLVVLGFDHYDKNRLAYWKCQCSCGNIVLVQQTHLINGSTQSCGCLNREHSKERASIHGMSRTRIYKIWDSMKRRCSNPNDKSYKYYGGRGIKVCPEWDGPNGFINFYNDMHDGYRDDLTIDRIDVNQGYCKENCQWVSNDVQQNNKTNSTYMEYYGQQYTLAQLGNRFGRNGVNGVIFTDRINNGWNIDEALDFPPNNGIYRANYYKNHNLITKPAIISPIEFDPSLKKDNPDSNLRLNSNYYFNPRYYENHEYIENLIKENNAKLDNPDNQNFNNNQ